LRPRRRNVYKHRVQILLTTFISGGKMSKYLIARQLSGKKLVTNDGEDFGRLVDIGVNEISGRIEYMVIEPSPDSDLASNLRKDDGMCHIPYESVLAVGDYIIVEKRNMNY